MSRLRLIFVILFLFSSSNVVFAENFPDGTVVVFENGSYLNVIQRNTGGNKTHVAIILYDGKQAWVYESSKPNVHRYTMDEYFKHIEAIHKKIPRLGVYFLKPKIPYTPAQLTSMKRYANAQLGRKFAIKSYLTGRQTNTIHCSEYVGNILEKSGRFTNKGPKEHPTSIFEKASKL